MSTIPPYSDSFQQAVAKFSLRLTKKELEDFKLCTLNDLRIAITAIQEVQGKKRELMNLTRVKAFLEAMDQYGKVIEVFLNASSILCFVWGPMKLILQASVSNDISDEPVYLRLSKTASHWTESFDTLLDAYQQLAQNIPLLEQYKTLLDDSPHMRSALSTMYEDILEFHLCALRWFTRPSKAISYLLQNGF
jgi:hypothetical protein